MIFQRSLLYVILNMDPALFENEDPLQIASCPADLKPSSFLRLYSFPTSICGVARAKKSQPLFVALTGGLQLKEVYCLFSRKAVPGTFGTLCKIAPLVCKSAYGLSKFFFWNFVKTFFVVASESWRGYPWNLLLIFSEIVVRNVFQTASKPYCILQKSAVSALKNLLRFVKMVFE